MIIVDTGPIVAAASAKDADHARSLDALADLREPPLISPFVVTEVCYFLSTRATPAAEAAFLRSLVVGTFQLVDLTLADLPLGAADASVIALAERLDVRTVMTLDRRHFSIVRPRHVGAFELLP